jgi:hypothetical protein
MTEKSKPAAPAQKRPYEKPVLTRREDLQHRTASTVTSGGGAIT